MRSALSGKGGPALSAVVNGLSRFCSALVDRTPHDSRCRHTGQLGRKPIPEHSPSVATGADPHVTLGAGRHSGAGGLGEGAS